MSAALTIHAACLSSRRIIFPIVLKTGSLTAILIDIVLVTLHCIVQLPTVPVSAALTIHEARSSSRHVIFAIVLATGSLTVILIDFVLVMS